MVSVPNPPKNPHRLDHKGLRTTVKKFGLSLNKMALVAEFLNQESNNEISNEKKYPSCILENTFQGAVLESFKKGNPDERMP